MSFGKNKTKKKTRNFDVRRFNAALIALAKPLRMNDPDIEPNELDSVLPSVDVDTSGLDVEQFIHTLNYRETVVLLFRALDTPTKEIAKILDLHPSRIYEIINSLEKKANDNV